MAYFFPTFLSGICVHVFFAVRDVCSHTFFFVVWNMHLQIHVSIMHKKKIVTPTLFVFSLKIIATVEKARIMAFLFRLVSFEETLHRRRHWARFDR